jgi:Zn-dependent protease with chaperone function
MFPLSITRVGVAFVVVAIFLGLIEQLVTFFGGSRQQADFGSTVGVIALLLSWPWIGPGLTERLIDPGKLQVDKAQHAELSQAIGRMVPAGVKRPKLVLFKDEAPRGVSLGTKHGSIMALSSGLSSSMNESQMQAVIAHELSHIMAGHTIQSFWLLGALFVAKALFGSFGLPIALFLLVIYLYLLRSNEYEADRQAAVLVGRESMSDALGRLKTTTRKNAMDESRWLIWLSTHPGLSQRIERLKGG